MRKQVEQAAGCFILTAQEAPETNRRMREDLYKKTMSADGIAGRRPYGIITRMIELVGWKRYELNRLMRFAGVTEKNFDSIFRRSCVWLPQARFIEESIIKNKFTDANAAGYFRKDDSLKKFLSSGPCVAAALRLQHGFEVQHSRETCKDLIEAYATQPLTEDAMREACGLPRKRRSGPDGELTIPVDSSSQESKNDTDQKFVNVAEAIRDECLQKGKTIFTKGMFKYLKLPTEHPSDMTRDAMWEELLSRKLVMAANLDNSKYKDGVMPFIQVPTKLTTIVDTKPGSDVTHSEVHDMSSLLKYATGCPEREANVCQVLEYLDKSVARLKKRGKQSAAAIEKMAILEKTKKKLVASETMLERPVHDQCAQPHEAPEGKRRRLARKTSAGAVNAARVEQTFRYRRNFQDLIRTRAYVEGDGSQKCSRRILQVLCADTHDLDIANSVFVIMHQLFERLDMKKVMPAHLWETLRKVATDRSGVCKALGLTVKEGKEVLHSCLFGANTPVCLGTDGFMRAFQRMALFMRWTACSLLPDVYELVRTMKEKRNPDASVLFYLYALVEDTVLQAWEDHLVSHFRPKHISLHFDGLRIDTSCLSGTPLRVHCAEAEKEIWERTGFKVTVVEKQHKYFLELCTQYGAARDDEALSDAKYACLRKDGNCILRAVAQLFPGKAARVLEYMQESSAANSQATWHGSRCYKDVLTALGLHAVPQLGFSITEQGKYLVHVEHTGRPHCVSVNAVLTDGNVLSVRVGGRSEKLDMPLTKLEEASQDAIDSGSIVTFRLFDQLGDVNWPADDLQTNLELLLQLHAGAGAESSDDVWVQDAAAVLQCSNKESDDECPDSSPAADDEDIVSVSSRLYKLLQEEVHRAKQRHSADKRCPLCPFRSFSRRDRLMAHIKTYHVPERQFVCSGTKQLKVVCALFDQDQLSRDSGSEYLKRSAEIMAHSIVPKLNCCVNDTCL